MLQSLPGAVEITVSKIWHGFYFHGDCTLNKGNVNKIIGQMILSPHCIYPIKKEVSKAYLKDK